MYGVSINDNNHKSISNNKQLYAKKIQKKKMRIKELVEPTHQDLFTQFG